MKSNSPSPCTPHPHPPEKPTISKTLPVVAYSHYPHTARCLPNQASRTVSCGVVTMKITANTRSPNVRDMMTQVRLSTWRGSIRWLGRTLGVGKAAGWHAHACWPVLSAAPPSIVGALPSVPAVLDSASGWAPEWKKKHMQIHSLDKWRVNWHPPDTTCIVS